MSPAAIKFSTTILSTPEHYIYYENDSGTCYESAPVVDALILQTNGRFVVLILTFQPIHQQHISF